MINRFENGDIPPSTERYRIPISRATSDLNPCAITRGESIWRRREISREHLFGSDPNL